MRQLLMKADQLQETWHSVWTQDMLVCDDVCEGPIHGNTIRAALRKGYLAEAMVERRVGDELPNSQPSLWVMWLTKDGERALIEYHAEVSRD